MCPITAEFTDGVLFDLASYHITALPNPLMLRTQTFRSKKLDGDEEQCVTKCAEKFLKLTKRTGYRFAEISFGAGAKAER